MSLISQEQLEDGAEVVAARPEFEAPWVKNLLSNPKKKWKDSDVNPFEDGTATNSMFKKTLRAKDCILAHLSFYQPSKEQEAIKGLEECWLLALGSGIDGATGRSHGGFNALVLDQISGSVAQEDNPTPFPPATATITVDYRAEVKTPCVILLRAWVIEQTGRKVWVRAVLENKDGVVCSASKGLFVFPKSQPRL